MINAMFYSSCEPNKDGGFMEWELVVYKDGEKIHNEVYDYERADKVASNHIADYLAVISLLKYLISKHFETEKIHITCHSQLVVSQMMGRWEIHEGKYCLYAQQAKKLMFAFKHKPEFIFTPKVR